MIITASRTLPYLMLAVGFVVFSAAFAGQGPAEADDVDWLQLGMGLFGGLRSFWAGWTCSPRGSRWQRATRFERS